MKMRSFFSRLCHYSILCLAAVTVVALAWYGRSHHHRDASHDAVMSTIIHDQARDGDLRGVKESIKENPDLVFRTDYEVGYNQPDNLRSDFAGETPLYVAASYGHKDVVEVLLANKADVNAKGHCGMTSLHAAASNCHKDVVEVLLANKADVNAKDYGGMMPLGYAVLKGNKNVGELLRRQGGHE
jgi:hypothetical protein